MDIEDEMEKIEELAHEEAERRLSEADEKCMGILEEYVAGGFYETLARLAVYLGKERAERALGKLSEEVRAEIEKRIDDKMSRADSEARFEAKHVLEKAGIDDKAMADFVIDGAGQKVFVALWHKRWGLFDRNPILANSVEKYMFLLEDIVHLSDRDTQRVLREVENTTLAKALKGKNTEAVREKFVRNMSKRAAEMLNEDIEFIGPIRIRDILAAQNEVLDIIRKLEDKGDIVIGRLGEDVG